MDSDINLKKIEDILKDEIYTLEEYLKYHEKKNKKLKDSLNNIAKYIDEDKRIMNASRNYVKEHDFCSDTKIDEEEIVDNINEVYSKMEVLHSQLCNITKKFAKLYFPQANEDSTNKAVYQTQISDECSSSAQPNSDVSNAKSGVSNSTIESRPKKSLLEILKELMYDLNPNSDIEAYGVMDIDDTVRFSDIEFLLSAGIVEQKSRSSTHIWLQNNIF